MKTADSRRRVGEPLVLALGLSAGAVSVAELAQAADAEPSRMLNTLVMPDAYEQVSGDQALSYAQLQRMARARRRGEPITILSKPDSSGFRHLVTMRYPTVYGWRKANEN